MKVLSFLPTPFSHDCQQVVEFWIGGGALFATAHNHTQEAIQKLNNLGSIIYNKKSEPSSLCFATGNIFVQMEFIITGHYPEVAI